MTIIYLCKLLVLGPSWTNIGRTTAKVTAMNYATTLYPKHENGRHTVQLMPIQVFRPGVTLATALMRALELLIKALPTSPALLRVSNAAVVLVIALFVVAVVDFAGPSATTRVVLVGRG